MKLRAHSLKLTYVYLRGLDHGNRHNTAQSMPSKVQLKMVEWGGDENDEWALRRRQSMASNTIMI